MVWSEKRKSRTKLCRIKHVRGRLVMGTGKEMLERWRRSYERVVYQETKLLSMA